MKKAELAEKTAISAGVDRMLTQLEGRHVNAMCIPDSKTLRVINGDCTHNYGDGYTAIVLTCRNDGSPESILEAINLMIASLSTAQ